MTTPELPTPGSPEAVAHGCLCPALDNHHGLGINIDPYVQPGERKFWVSGNCPLHGSKESDSC